MQSSVGRMAKMIDGVMDLARGRSGGGIPLSKSATVWLPAGATLHSEGRHQLPPSRARIRHSSRLNDPAISTAPTSMRATAVIRVIAASPVISAIAAIIRGAAEVTTRLLCPRSLQGQPSGRQPPQAQHLKQHRPRRQLQHRHLLQRRHRQSRLCQRWRHPYGSMVRPPGVTPFVSFSPGPERAGNNASASSPWNSYQAQSASGTVVSATRDDRAAAFICKPAYATNG